MDYFIAVFAFGKRKLRDSRVVQKMFTGEQKTNCNIALARVNSVDNVLLFLRANFALGSYLNTCCTPLEE